MDGKALEVIGGARMDTCVQVIFKADCCLMLNTYPEPKSFPISRLPAGKNSPKDSYEVNFSYVTNCTDTKPCRGAGRDEENATECHPIVTVICHNDIIRMYVGTSTIDLFS